MEYDLCGEFRAHRLKQNSPWEVCSTEDYFRSLAHVHCHVKYIIEHVLQIYFRITFENCLSFISLLSDQGAILQFEIALKEACALECWETRVYHLTCISIGTVNVCIC